jgi:malate synthase
MQNNNQPKSNPLKPISYYRDYLSPNLLHHLQKKHPADFRPVPGVPQLMQIGSMAGLESTESLKFVCDLFTTVHDSLLAILNQRTLDRKFIDDRTQCAAVLNNQLGIDIQDPDYQTILGQQDSRGRIVVGPNNEYFCKAGYGQPIAPLPEPLKGNHITLFGPPDDAKLSINAMNAYHRKLKNEPPIIEALLKNSKIQPKWGADDEDSKTPLRVDLTAAEENLSRCFRKTLEYTDEKSNKSYRLEADHLAHPIKRFPGLALPCSFLFFQDQPIPLHLYDFALHFFHHWNQPDALHFYVPKLENEEEAAYIRLMIESAEQWIQNIHPEYQVGSVRLLIVLENPRAIFRVNEIMDALGPYFAGASLGWHDYLASTARLFKHDSNYRIPVKADPDIVIKYIKASHDLLAQVVGSRGGIKIGGMYGILPIENDITSPSFQITLRGFIKDVVTQLRRDLTGFWVAHPDFIRIGIALVEAWKLKIKGSPTELTEFVTAFLQEPYRSEVLKFIEAPDQQGLNIQDPIYARSLLVADLKVTDSTVIANHDPEEIRYNVFQSLQYLADWLSGNGCVALPATVNGITVRVMDDLATAERSRWEVWHEIHHGRVSVEDFIKIAHEELLYIRKDYQHDQQGRQKLVQVKWNERTQKWYPIAFELMIQLMTAKNPNEFATELLMPFTLDPIRSNPEPLKFLKSIEPSKYNLDPYVDRLSEYFSICGCMEFAKPMAAGLSPDVTLAEHIIMNFSVGQIQAAASFHGNIGESKKTLDAVAAAEQSGVLQNSNAKLTDELIKLGQEYLKRFGFKYLISAQGKSAEELLTALKVRMNQSVETEIQNARHALLEISLKRLRPVLAESLNSKIDLLLKKHSVMGAQISFSPSPQSLAFGNRSKSNPVTSNTWFQLASLSKSFASCYAIEYFKNKKIPLTTSVDSLLEKTKSKFRINSANVTLEHLMNHQALNLHYVNGIPADRPMPNVSTLIAGNAEWGYDPIKVLFEPGSEFRYSGGGFLVLEHLIEVMEENPIAKSFLDLPEFSFDPRTLPAIEYAHGYLTNHEEVAGTRKMFPSFAAGAMGTAASVCHFLNQLTSAYHRIEGAGSVSHTTARKMLNTHDRSSQNFMGVNIGFGIFVAEAGPNRLAIHQGANDGFRALFVHCFDGPDRGQGFVILCNADSHGVNFIAETAQEILKELKWAGVRTDLFKTEFNPAAKPKDQSAPKEQWVNLGYKEMIFDAFIPDLPDAIGPSTLAPVVMIDPLSPYNKVQDAKIIYVSDQRFARAENLIAARQPLFDPELYCYQGKVMDSWESARHQRKPKSDPHDELMLELDSATEIEFVSFSTEYHDGNHGEFVSLEGQPEHSTLGQPWDTLVPKIKLKGHSLTRLRIPKNLKKYKKIKIYMYPDGGLSRLGVYDHTLPLSDQIQFQTLESVQNGIPQSIRFSHPIPQPVRPLVPIYDVKPERIQKNWSRLKQNHADDPTAQAFVDVACSALGGKVISASNQHYGPASQSISPYPPVHMFDGFESARSRIAGHNETLVLELGKIAVISHIDLDFSFFRNNNPEFVKIEGLMNPNIATNETASDWVLIVPKTPVKHFAGNQVRFDHRQDFEPQSTQNVYRQIKITVFPDGGIHRVKVYSKI